MTFMESCLDKRHVANKARWRCQEDRDVVMQMPEAWQRMAKAASIATSFEPIGYGLREIQAPRRTA